MAEGHRRCSGEDRISELPDELLHVILLRLGSSRAAARTSALSRRWRRVWAHLPELRLGTHHDPPPLPASLLDAVDGALAGYSATAPLEHLGILFFTGGPNVTASRAAPWLRFAAKHVVGEFNLRVPYQKMGKDQEELELPACTRAKTIKLKLQDPWRLRPQLACTFAALISLTIRDCRMEAKELTAMVSKHCLCLRDLILFIDLVEVSDVSVLSDTLHSLTFFVANTRQLEVIAGNLEKLTVDDAAKARISSSKLAEVDAYDPRHHKFDNVGRHLRRLEVGQNSAVASFMQQFDEVDDLKLEIFVPWESP
nr:unnamed protein product [Digitaria exilis]